MTFKKAPLRYEEWLLWRIEVNNPNMGHGMNSVIWLMIN
ncbi:hypothetical protein GAPWKB30_2123 [Gilliamella apicola]|jgi:hypothetical protein|nr:hypothetical protein GAPWKB30_2123 [Gilliamella apicola]